MRSSELALCVALLSLSGCFEPIEHEGRRCPCVAGFVCDTSSDHCVREGTDAESPVDDAFVAEGPDASATTTDAWAVDAAMPDAREPDAGGFLHCPPGIRVCDDFESASTDRFPPWDHVDGDPMRVTDRAARGTASGFFSAAPPEGQQSFGIEVVGDPREVWARFWLLIRPSVGGPARDGAVFLLSDDVPPAFDGIAVLLGGDGLGIYNGVVDNVRAGPAIPADTWRCIALHVVVGDPGLIELYDGRMVAASSTDRTVFPGGPIRVIDAGLTYVDVASGPLSVYLDDIAIAFGSTPLLCP